VTKWFTWERAKVSSKPRFAANLSWLFLEWPFLDRFAAAADAGFTAVEYLFPYDHAPGDIAQALARHGLQQVLFNLRRACT
jgi:hydroxypyruvate isomerase